MFKKIVESMNDGVYIRDMSYNLLFMNRQLENIVNQKADEAVGVYKCYQLFGLSGPCPDCPVDAQAQNIQPGDMIKKFISGNGSILKFMVTSSLLEGKGLTGNGIVILKDVTRFIEMGDASQKTIKRLMEEIKKSKHMEESLRKSEERYRATFEYTGTAMIVVEENRIISMANREVERVCGYTQEELVNKKRWDEFVHPDDLDRMLKYHAGRRKGNKYVPEKYEFRLIHKDGSTKNIMFTMGIIPGTGQSIGSMVDLTGQRCSERALKETVDKNRILIETIEDGFFEVDRFGNFLTVNEALCKDIGYSSEELLSMNYSSLVDSRNARKLFKAFNKVYKSGRNEKHFSWEYTRKNGSKGIVEVSVSLLRDEKGDFKGFCGTAREITERVRIEEKLKYLSLHDPLTGLFNRSHFEEAMERAGSPHFLPVTIICMDLNGLKLVNDTMGHKTGDEIIKATAGVLNKFFRSSDMVARVGGDEFVVILSKTGENSARNIVKRIRRSFYKYNSNNPELPLSIAIGCATRKTEEMTMEETFKLADANMYKDKLLKG